MEFMQMPMPEEMRQQIEHNRMVTEDLVHSVTGFVYSLDPEGLRALSNLLDAIATGGGKRAAIYWQGQVDGLLRERHNICPIHNVDHEAQMIQAFTERFEGSTETNDSTPVAEPVTKSDSLPDVEPMMDPLEYKRLLREYNLIDDGSKIRCFKCNSTYVSLEDRMLKAPDDCHFCQTREGQG